MFVAPFNLCGLRGCSHTDEGVACGKNDSVKRNNIYIYNYIYARRLLRVKNSYTRTTDKKQW